MRSWAHLSNKGTRELVMTFQNPHHPDSDYAFYALTDRFKGHLLRYCEIRCDKYGHQPSVAIELAENVFKSYAKFQSFDFDRAKTKNDDRAFQIYLNSIARRELINIFRLEKRKREGKWSDGSEQLITKVPSIKSANPKAQIIIDVLNSLPYSHRVIYLTYKAYETVGCNLPKGLQEKLRAHLGGIKQTTIRSYKKETLDLIQMAVKYAQLESS